MNELEELKNYSEYSDRGILQREFIKADKRISGRLCKDRLSFKAG